MTADSATILYIDDEKPILEMIRQSLGRMGYGVLAVENPEEALDLFRFDPGRFDMVITDQVMPEMNGDRLAEKLLNIRPEIPIILCTGSAGMNLREVYALGVRACLLKPVARACMAETIRRLLSQPAVAPTPALPRRGGGRSPFHSGDLPV